MADDKIGIKINKLTIIGTKRKQRITPSRVRNELFYICLCDCGEITEVVDYALMKGNTKSCGCLRVEKAKKHSNLIGEKFGRLTVVSKTNEKLRGKRDIVWQCECDCGNIHKAITSDLKTGNTQSCGCLQKETRLIGIFKSGEDHPSWKGGITHIGLYLRERLKDWKIASMEQSNYKCVISGEKFEAIHHLYPFHLILNETLKIAKIPLLQNISDYLEDELEILLKICIELHEKYPLGVCLTKDLHNEFHSKYGIKNFTPENFQEFFYLKTGKEFDFSTKGDVMIG